MIQVLSRFHKILRAAADLRVKGASLGELAKAADISPQTCLHIVKTMVALGYLEHDEIEKNYRPGSFPSLFADRDEAFQSLKNAGAKALDALSAATGEMCVLVVEAGGNREVLDFRESLREVAPRAEPRRIPGLLSTPTGLVLLSGKSESIRKQVVENMSKADFEHLPVETPVKGAGDLFRLLGVIEAAGEHLLAPDKGDLDPVAALAFAVKKFGRITAAIGVKVPGHRYTKEAAGKIVSAGRAAAQKIESALNPSSSR